MKAKKTQIETNVERYNNALDTKVWTGFAGLTPEQIEGRKRCEKRIASMRFIIPKK